MQTLERDHPASYASRREGDWSREPPPYRTAIVERAFVRLKQRWLQSVMRTNALVPSHRIAAYFIADLLNWATMDCWMSHQYMAKLIGTSGKTVQRALFAMEDMGIVSIWRLKGSRYPLRYAPVYLGAKVQDTAVEQSGHGCSEAVDATVHESFLSTQSVSTLSAAKAAKRFQHPQSHHEDQGLSFKLSQRGKLELEVAHLIGGYDKLSRLAAVNDEIVNRLCEAQHRCIFDQRLIKATRLAAKQVRSV